MHQLYTYLCNIHSQPSMMHVVSKTESIERISDGGDVIEEHEIFYVFNNGVKILYKMEFDMFQPDDVCYECWISYEVVHDSGYAVSPQKKQFYNRSQ